MAKKSSDAPDTQAKTEAAADKQKSGKALPDVPPPDVPDNVGTVDRLPVVIHSQYIRDLSFENPNAPIPLRRADGEGGIDVDFSMDARKLEIEGYEDAYEVILMVSVHAKKGQSSTFIAELEYGMMVSVQDVPPEKVHPLLLIEMPGYMFPFVRQIIADMTQQAGYMPFLLSPVNFKALYRRRFGGPQVNEPAKKEKQSA